VGTERNKQQILYFVWERLRPVGRAAAGWQSEQNVLPHSERQVIGLLIAAENLSSTIFNGFICSV
jgi:hypothetical protein